MIYAKLDKLVDFLDPEIRHIIKDFLNKVDINIPDGRYEIAGEKIFARIETYDTLPAEENAIEAHNRYIDIQFTLDGAEGISVFDRNSMKEKVSYDEKNDVLFFECDENIVMAHTDNIPGYFTMLFPEDAHRPKERIRGIDSVKKAVIKVRVKE